MSGAGSSSRISRNNSEKNSHNTGDTESNNFHAFWILLQAIKGKGRRVEQTQNCLWALLHLLHCHMAASQISCNCTASCCIWTCLPLHQPVYWHGADIGIGAQRISHISDDGTQCFFLLKTFGLWLFCRLPWVIPCISGMISTSTGYSHYCDITLLLLLAFFPRHRFPYSTSVSNDTLFFDLMSFQD